MNPLFKIGDSFALPVQFYDVENKDGYAITQDMKITAKIINMQNEVLAEPIITVYPDQTTDKGMILLEVAAATTQMWKEGKAQMDIKLVMNGNVRHSQNISFHIVRSIT